MEQNDKITEFIVFNRDFSKSPFRLSSFLKRYQDEDTQASFMTVSSARWMGVRLELLCAIFITAVAIGSLVIDGSPGL